LQGFSQPIGEIEGFEKCELTPALFALAVIELHLVPIASGSEIRDLLEDQYMGVDQYEGHDVGDIQLMFSPLVAYHVDSDFEFTSDPLRAVGSYVARTYDNGPLPLSDKTRNSLVRIFETGNRWIPFQLVLQGILSFSWASLYLEIYRCIENMYPYARIKKLTENWPPHSSLRDIAILLEKELSWRPREEEALASIIRQCSGAASQKLLQSFNMQSDSIVDPSAAAARLVYATRNELVHFRPREETASRDDAIWDRQVCALIDCLEEVYRISGDFFHELQQVVTSADVSPRPTVNGVGAAG